MQGVYLIHFERPFGHARHYIGYAYDVDKRYKEHQAGRGARLIQVVREAGIAISLVRTWKGATRTFERRLKRRRKSRALCPICNPDHWENNAKETTTPT